MRYRPFVEPFVAVHFDRSTVVPWLPYHGVDGVVAQNTVLGVELMVFEPRGNGAAVTVCTGMTNFVDGLSFLDSGDDRARLRYCAAAEADGGRETATDSPAEFRRHDDFDVLFLNEAAKKDMREMLRRAVRQQLPLSSSTTDLDCSSLTPDAFCTTRPCQSPPRSLAGPEISP